MPDEAFNILSGVVIFAGILFGVGCWIRSKPREQIDQWQPPWLQRLSNRGRRAGSGWEELTGLDGAVELGHLSGAANGTPTDPARHTAHGTTHATADDTATGEASGTAAATPDATRFATIEITPNGAASGPR